MKFLLVAIIVLSGSFFTQKTQADPCSPDKLPLLSVLEASVWWNKSTGVPFPPLIHGKVLEAQSQYAVVQVKQIFEGVVDSQKDGNVKIWKGQGVGSIVDTSKWTPGEEKLIWLDKITADWNPGMGDFQVEKCGVQHLPIEGGLVTGNIDANLKSLPIAEFKDFYTKKKELLNVRYTEIVNAGKNLQYDCFLESRETSAWSFPKQTGQIRGLGVDGSARFAVGLSTEPFKHHSDANVVHARERFSVEGSVIIQATLSGTKVSSQILASSDYGKDRLLKSGKTELEFDNLSVASLPKTIRQVLYADVGNAGEGSIGMRLLCTKVTN